MGVQGKGTAAVDGEALLLAVIRHLLRRRTASGVPKVPFPNLPTSWRPFSRSCAQVLLITHFGDVFDYGLLAAEDCVDLSFYQMETLLQQPAGEDGRPSADHDEVVPLFRLVPGRSTSSFGIACARQAGMPASILQRASQVRPCLCLRV